MHVWFCIIIIIALSDFSFCISVSLHFSYCSMLSPHFFVVSPYFTFVVWNYLTLPVLAVDIYGVNKSSFCKKHCPHSIHFPLFPFDQNPSFIRKSTHFLCDPGKMCPFLSSAWRRWDELNEPLAYLWQLTGLGWPRGTQSDRRGLHPTSLMNSDSRNGV